ncbi:unnamed protein product [Paramecium sonneborni]|uniref:Uncharacterized protein n=1 Tax=Paramecium sonneborni TaxID=65129 RepID=A0A8S1RRX8_9CILI|nr:unnamed protein product [Paramecium sonneborni]
MKYQYQETFWQFKKGYMNQNLALDNKYNTLEGELDELKLDNQRLLQINDHLKKQLQKVRNERNQFERELRIMLIISFKQKFIKNIKKERINQLRIEKDKYLQSEQLVSALQLLAELLKQEQIRTRQLELEIERLIIKLTIS